MAAVVLLLIFCFGTAALILCKVWNLNQYLVPGGCPRGVDVSHYQGEIRWELLEEQGVSFAFIKATEGSSHLDGNFAKNWQASGETGILSGAYHFFSFDSPGKNQADWFMENVGSLNGRLVPAVDVEYYGDKEVHPPEKEPVVKELREYLQALEEHYQVKPVIYTTYKVYRRYLEGEFEEYPLWIRNVYYPPDVDLRGKWQFWQYTDRAVLKGYEGTEKYIDLNAFGGSREELEGYVVGGGM